MKKIIISIVALAVSSSVVSASEVGGSLSTGVSTSGLNFSLACPAVSHGTVTNTQTCAFTCESGYAAAGTNSVNGSCTFIPVSSWGGGGGGGSITTVTTTGSTSSSTATGTTVTTSTGTSVSVNTGTTTTVTVSDNTNLTLNKAPTGVTVTVTTPTGTTTVTFTKPAAIFRSSSQIKATDITESWAKTYIQKLVARWVVNNAEKYNPDNNLTRAEFLKIIMNAAGWKIGTGTTAVFSDVPSDMWYAPYVSLALSKGMISPNAQFRPNDTISRAEAAKIIVKIFGVKTVDAKGIFADMDVSSDLTQYAEVAKALGIFSGQIIDGKLIFRPNDSITRAEIAKVIVNAFGL